MRRWRRARFKLGLRQVDGRTPGSELGGHPNEVGERSSLHLLHYVSTMSLYGDFADAELSPPTCLFSRPATTSAMTCRSLEESEA